VSEPTTDLTWTPAHSKYWLCIRPEANEGVKKSETSLSARWEKAGQTLYQRETSTQVGGRFVRKRNLPENVYGRFGPVGGEMATNRK